MLHGKYQDVDEVLVDGIFEENVLYNQFRNNQKQLWKMWLSALQAEIKPAPGVVLWPLIYRTQLHL